MKTDAGGKSGVSGGYQHPAFMSSQFNEGIRGVFRVPPLGVTKRFGYVNRTPTTTTDATAIP